MASVAIFLGWAIVKIAGRVRDVVREIMAVFALAMVAGSEKRRS